MQNLPESKIKNNAIALTDAVNTEELQHIVNTYMYGYRTGLPRGQSNAILYLAENGDADERICERITKRDVAKTEINKTTKAEDKPEDDQDINATFK